MTEQLIRELIALDPIEQIAKEYFERTGEYMPRAMYVSLRAKTWPEGKKEEALFDYDLGVRIYKIPRYVDLPDRSHDYVECIYVAEGTLEHKVNGVWHTGERGAFYYIPLNNAHSVRLGEDSLCFVIDVTPEVFRRLGLPNDAVQIFPMVYPTEGDERLRDMVFAMWTHQADDPVLYANVVYHIFFALAYYLVQKYRYEIRNLTYGVFTNPVSYDLLHYITEHYRTVTLKELAEEFHFSVPYLSTLIHKEFGMPFSALLREYRLGQAEEMLRESTKKVEEIAKLVGFQEAAQFIRAFKSKYGVTPAKYRSQHRDVGRFTS